MPDYLHEVLVAWLARVLGTWAESSQAIVGWSEAKFTLSSSRGRKADLTVYFAGRRPPARGVITIPPDLAVEVLSPAPRDQRRDRVDKMDEYGRFGIRFYWLVDPQRRTLEIYELGADGRYVLLVESSSGSLQDVPGCAGLTLDLDAMWSKIDALEHD